ncbi:hypothetical protein [Haloprofundus salinisoli]|uniref:hypothetical protein n=1 Tax=Haloprofundus salinisoli TaxID=2876193 RepID=UPI001CCDBFA5|nr:hypothetical protein [Haloprofundus salinisoli]
MSNASKPKETGEKIEVAMPLFGGGDAYLETLKRVLEFVEMASPEEQKLIQWFKTSFSNVSSDYSIHRRLQFLQSLRFIAEEDGVFTLGAAGRRLRATESADVVYNILKSKVTAVEEILGYLCRGQVEIETLENALDHDYDRVKWKLNWLRSLGFVNQVNGEIYIATAEGQDAFRVYSEPDFSH